MIHSFTATVVAVHEEEEFVVVGIGRDTPDGYLMFQRSLPIGGEEDCGVYLESDDEESFGYDVVTRCMLWRERLLVELTEPIDPEGCITGIDVRLSLSESRYSALAGGLERVFADAGEVFQKAEG